MWKDTIEIDMYIAVDDTDSIDGMCTTFLASELIKEFNEFDLLSHPRLVRLNPNVPWKTRGNGAISISFGKGHTREDKIGKIDKHVFTHKGEHSCVSSIFDRIKNIVEEIAHFDDKKTNPGFVVSDKKPPFSLYEKAVQDVVELEDVLKILDKNGFKYKGYGNKRGLIGATAAMAWRPRDHTYELLSYRKEKNWGTERELYEKEIKRLDKELKQSFDSYDHEEDEQTIAPNSPCPVLYGVRGDDPYELKKALKMLSGEDPERWIIFLTNQGTDDHIQEVPISEVRPWTSVKIKGEVSSIPEIIEGGHVLFEVKALDDDIKITAAAYEPTKGFREHVKKLIKGDLIELRGGIRKEPKTLNIEKMKILKLQDKVVKVSNPKCPECSKKMSSMGKNAGYRCKRCRIKADEKEAIRKKVDRGIEEDWYETPVKARRHLSKPLKRLKRTKEKNRTSKK